MRILATRHIFFERLWCLERYESLVVWSSVGLMYHAQSQQVYDA